MADAMIFSEVDDQLVELLPARTVLSLLRAIPVGIGTPGEPGGRGNDGSGTVGSTMGALIDNPSSSLIDTTGPAA